jgi:hypothetical protein
MAYTPLPDTKPILSNKDIAAHLPLLCNYRPPNARRSPNPSILSQLLNEGPSKSFPFSPIKRINLKTKEPIALLSILLPLLPLTTTAPPHTPPPTHNLTHTLTKRDNIGGVYFCANANWVPPCTYVIIPLGRCASMITGGYWDSISSFGPDLVADTAAWHCTLWSQLHCQVSGSTTLSYPGSQDLWNQNMNDGVRSFTCDWD